VSIALFLVIGALEAGLSSALADLSVALSASKSGIFGGLSFSHFC
jgi:hypothetical protein